MGTVLLAGFEDQNQPKEPSPWLSERKEAVSWKIA